MSRFPPPPVSTIDWSNVGFKVREGRLLRQLKHSAVALLISYDVCQRAGRTY